ncbi:hypothetical protein N7527_000171 [Penicillium freii]|nr:hypothetical protein N7527_000171 [Penicillium freii]
MRRSRLSPTWT